MADSPQKPGGAAHWLHISFYRFVPLKDPTDAANCLRHEAQKAGLGGSVIVAAEGISGALAGPVAQVQSFESTVVQPGFLNGALQGLVFKRTQSMASPFARLKVSVKPEIVALGLPQFDTLATPDEHDDSHLSPAAWRELLARDDVVVLDNRNHFEYRLGHFKGAVDPQVHNFRDFVDYVQAQAPAWRAEGSAVAMYCTGGIRCDKTAPWMRSLGLKVWQLDGGIINYCQQLGDAGTDWLGECFVFDKRIALDAQLRETGTTAAAVFDPSHADEAWRLERARRLDPAAP